MKTFHCDHCGNLVFFENTVCTSCNSKLAFLPDRMAVTALQPLDDVNWQPLGAAESAPQSYKLCANYSAENVCNWAIPDSDPEPLCPSCRLSRTIPDLGQQENREQWYKMEAAKRRMVFELLSLGLPIQGRQADPEQGLAFDFLSDSVPGSGPVLTGHDRGLITINLAEANDAERERRRVAMHEPYRTLLGHFRHEIGHYYWDRLIAGTEFLEPCRQVFGDETQDYAAALKRHYDNGPGAGWNQSFVSEYATAHPWEDWAETWAHYLHIMDTLETAYENGVSLRPLAASDPGFVPLPSAELRSAPDFRQVMQGWFPLTRALNNFSRSLGVADVYPFVLAPAVVDKLAFVHRVVAAQTAVSRQPASAQQQAQAQQQQTQNAADAPIAAAA